MVKKKKKPCIFKYILFYHIDLRLSAEYRSLLKTRWGQTVRYKMYARFYEQLFWEFWRGGYVFQSCPSSALCPNAQPRVSDMVFKFALLICTKFTSDIRICENCDIPQTERTFFINSEIPQKKMCVQSVGGFSII